MVASTGSVRNLHRAIVASWMLVASTAMAVVTLPPVVTVISTHIVITDAAVLTGPTGIVLSAGFYDLLGPVSGTGPLTVNGIGGVLLGGTDTFTGGLGVGGGAAVAVNGTFSGPVNVDFAGGLTGTGSITGPVTVGANGNLNPANGVLTTGDLSVAGFTNVNLSGPVRGSGYGAIDVNGTVTLGGPLKLAGSYTPVAGDVFTLIENDGADAVAGTFAGLPEGAFVVFNGVLLRISYAGGTGNDVTLATAIAQPVPTPTLSEWVLFALGAILLALGMRAARARH